MNIKQKPRNTAAMRSNLLLVLTAFIWGVAFVAQSVGMDYVGPFTFNASRNIIAPIVLLPFIVLTGKRNRDLETVARGEEETAQTNKKKAIIKKGIIKSEGTGTLLLAGLLSGTALCVASCLQQYGIMTSTVGKSGFITALYILIVPLLGLFVGKRVGRRVWISVAIAIIGLYLLCMAESLSFSRGDIFLLLCALCFSFQILIVDYYSPKVNGVHMAALQFLVSGIISSILALTFEHPSMDAILAAWKPILYAGAMSSAVGYTLQIIAQKDTDPVIASLLMSLESAFSLLAGWVILGQHLSPRELSGCALMFAAIMLAQIPEKQKVGSTS